MATVLSGAQVSPSGEPGPIGQGLPIGSVVDFAGSVEPAGWIFCFGQSLLRAGTYAELFAVVGTAYGSVDGTHFNTPDLRGRVAAGKDDMGGVSANRLTTPVNGDSLGANGGAESHTLTIAQMPAHNHTINAIAYSAGSYFPTSAGGGIPATGTGTTGGGDEHNNVQPTFVLNKIIKY